MKISFFQTDEEDNPEIQYLDMIGPMSNTKGYVEVPCPSRQVVSITCAGLDCGRRPARVEADAAARIAVGDENEALHGDWPWHAALYKNGAHVCDGTLVRDSWIMTTASCFQG